MMEQDLPSIYRNIHLRLSRAIVLTSIVDIFLGSRWFCASWKIHSSYLEGSEQNNVFAANLWWSCPSVSLVIRQEDWEGSQLLGNLPRSTEHTLLTWTVPCFSQRTGTGWHMQTCTGHMGQWPVDVKFRSPIFSPLAAPKRGTVAHTA